MFYLGHFSFDELDYQQNIRHGYLTCVVEAADEDTAVEQFKDHLFEMKRKNVAFSSIVKVYIEDIIQIKDVPSEPVITRLQSSKGEFPKSISYSLPSIDTEGVEAYGLTANVNKTENEPDGGYVVSEPFINFQN